MRLTFRKDERLHRKKELELVLKKGRTIQMLPFKVLYYTSERNETEQLSPIKIGISIPKRLFKRAVDRNLLKRRTKEAYRINRIPLKKFLIKENLCLWVFLIYQKGELLNYDQIEDKIILILQRLHSIHEKNSE